MLREVRDAVRGHPRVAAGYALYWTWVALVLQGQDFFGPAEMPGVGVPSWVLAAAASVAAYALYGVRFALTRRLPGRASLLVSCVACVAGSVAGMGAAAGVDAAALLWAGPVLVGAGTVGILIAFTSLFAALGMHRAVPLTVACYVAGVLAVCAVGVLPALARHAMVVAIAIALSALLAGMSPTIFAAGVWDRGATAERYVPLRLVVGDAVGGCSYGIMATVGGAGALSGTFDAALLLVAGVFFMLTVRYLELDFARLMFFLVPLVSGVGLVLGLVWPGSVLSWGAVRVALGYSDLVGWLLFIYFVETLGFSATWVVFCGSTSLIAGQVAGVAIGSAVMATGSAEGLAQLYGIAAFVVVAVGFACYACREARYPWGQGRPGAARDQQSMRGQAIEGLRRAYGLTAREVDVMDVLARGYTRRAAAEHLCLSEETVKAYTKGVYRKLGVSSKQEIIDLVEGRVAGE